MTQIQTKSKKTLIKRLSTGSLLFKLIAPVFTTIIITGIIIDSYQCWHSKRQLIANIRMQLLNSARLIQEQTAIAAALGDKEQLKFILNNFKSNKDFIYGAILDTENLCTLYKIKKGSKNSLNQLNNTVVKKTACRNINLMNRWQEGETLFLTTLTAKNAISTKASKVKASDTAIVELSVPLYVLKVNSTLNEDLNVLPPPVKNQAKSNHNRLVGTLRIGFSILDDLKTLEKENRTTFLNLILLLSTACLFIGAFVYKTVQRIKKIATYADNIDDGVPSDMISVEGNDEIADLATSFNSMMVRLQSARTLEKCLQRSSKLASLGQITAGVAHEFNNILQIIDTHTELAIDDTTQNPEAQNSLSVIMESSNRASKIVSALLAFSREKKLERKKHGISCIIEKTISLMSPQFKASKIEIIQMLKDIPETFIDEGQFQQVLINLFNNAIQACSSKGIITVVTNFIKENETTKEPCKNNKPDNTAQVSSKNQLLKNSPDGLIEITISDNGRGIEAKNLDRIFDPFFSTRNMEDNNAVPKGTGIGLAVCFGIIAQHNGYINVNSTPGKGTTFTIHLPLASQPSETKSLNQISIFNSPHFSFRIPEE